MPPNNKTKELATLLTLKKNGRSAGRRKQQPPFLPPSDTEALSMEDDEEPSLKSVMALLGTMNSRLGTCSYKKRLDGLTADASRRAMAERE